MRNQKDDLWFSREVEAMAPTMFHVAFAILRNGADCEDAAQNAALKAYANLDTLRERRYFRTWLIRILKNECLTMMHARQHTEDIDSQISLGCEMEVPDPDLYRAFEKLTADERIAITLFYYEGYSTREIAKICEVSDGTVRSRLSRARETLREQLSDKEAKQ